MHKAETESIFCFYHEMTAPFNQIRFDIFLQPSVSQRTSMPKFTVKWNDELVDYFPFCLVGTDQSNGKNQNWLAIVVNNKKRNNENWTNPIY